jgi:hypothetical protein
MSADSVFPEKAASQDDPPMGEELPGRPTATIHPLKRALPAPPAHMYEAAEAAGRAPAPEPAPEAQIPARPVRRVMEQGQGAAPATEAGPETDPATAADATDGTVHVVRRVIEDQRRLGLQISERPMVTGNRRRRQQLSNGRRAGGPGNGTLAVLSGLFASFMRRPDAPRVMAMTTLIVVFLVAPLRLLAIGLIVAILGLIAYIALGPDRVNAWVSRWYARLRNTDPQGAETLRRRAALVTGKLSDLLDRLPARWTAGIYLPDFDEISAPPEKMQADPFERLTAQLSGSLRR